MKLEYLIPTPEERIFIVDQECLLFFTGKDINDQLPLLRLGAWSEMPPEIPSLIETIIITEDFYGNPLYEKFNVKNQKFNPQNYIGDQKNVQNYLELQKNLALSLANSPGGSPQDIPFLATKKNISEKDHFIGIFYKNGNFRILYNQKEIFSLEKLKNNSLNYSQIHEQLSFKNQATRRYQKNGLIILDDHPLFFSQNKFISFSCPKQYLELFSTLRIDPKAIKTFLFSSDAKIMNLIHFLKWKKVSNQKIKIYANPSKIISALDNFLGKKTITRKDFEKFYDSSIENLKIKNYSRTTNSIIIFEKTFPSSLDISLTYLEDKSDIAKIISEQTDAFLIDFTLYQKINLLFKSVNTPIIIINNEPENIKKLIDEWVVILDKNVQYNFFKSEEANYIYAIQNKKYYPLIESLSNQNLSEISNSLNSFNNDNRTLAKNINIFNTLSFIKFFIYTSREKNFLSNLEKIKKNLKESIDFSVLKENYSTIEKNLILFKNYIFEYITEIDQSESVKDIFYDQIPDSLPELEKNYPQINQIQKKFWGKIIEDRNRLNKLIKWRDPNFKPKNYSYELDSTEDFFKNQPLAPQEQLLKTENRQKIKNNNEIKVDNRYKQPEKDLNENKFSQTSIKNFASQKPKNNNIYIKALIILIIILILSLGLSFLIEKLVNSTINPSLAPNLPKKVNKSKKTTINKNDLKKTSFESSKKNSPELEKEKSISGTNKNPSLAPNLPKKVNELKKMSEIKPSYVTEQLVAKYAKKVALKNGYGPISQQDFKDKKNPHWIYPGNIITMLDGEKIKVKTGDNIWKLCRQKLEKKN